MARPPHLEHIIQKAAWATMARHRAQVQDTVRCELPLSYDFGRGGRLHQLLGSQAPPAKGAGPQIVLERPYDYYAAKHGVIVPVAAIGCFTTTAKMSAMSFSLPAGPVASGGTCPAALPAVADKLAATQPAVAAQLRPVVDPIRPFAGQRLGDYICTKCYAGKNMYVVSPLNAIRQTLRLRWTQDALAAGAFVPEMIRALQFCRDLPVSTQRAYGIDTRFFRIHDSGDFFSTAYWRAWVAIAAHFQARSRYIAFWAPIRMWIFPKWQALFASDPPPENLTVRPSALSFGAPAPDVDTLDAGSTAAAYPMGSLAPRTGRRGPRPDMVWDCPAYTGDTEAARSCAGQKCRVCWVRPDVAVAYKEH